MNKIKFFLLLTLTTFLVIGCKTAKKNNCDAYGYNTPQKDSIVVYRIPYVDTVIMDEIHYHYEYENLCTWTYVDTNIYADTFEIELIFN